MDAGEPPIVTSTYASGLSAGSDKACVITTAGTLKCWGGTRDPEPLAAGETWKHVATGGITQDSGIAACAIRSDDTLWCWAHPGTTLVQPHTGSFQYVRVSPGSRCAIATSGELYCWGHNNVFGPLGTNDTIGRVTPTLIGTDKDWKLVAPGGNHTCAIKTSGALYCWGWNGFGQVGHGGAEMQRNEPVAIDTANTYLDVDTRGVQTCAIRTDGSLHCWGSGAILQSNIPKAIDAAKDWAKVRVGVGFACGLKTNGSIHCFGSNDRGQLSLPVIAGNLSRPTPQQVGSAVDWDDLATGDAFACAKKKTTGTVWCWGSNSGNQLGGNPPGNHLSPKRVGAAGEFANVGAGSDNVCAVRSNGSLACWGNYGGMPETGVPSQVPLTIGNATDWKTVKPGWTGACATKTSDALHCWNTGAAPAGTPLTVSSYDVGYFHQCAVASGSLYCWGDNVFGKAGGGPPILTDPALAKVGTATWTTVAANFDSTCAIQTDGTLWCMGWAIGATPKKVGTLATWTAVDRSAGANNGWHGLAGGRLYSWTGASNPVASPGPETDWTVVASSALHVCGIRAGGTLWCKGTNDYGQLGDGTITTRNDATQVGTDADWVSVTAGNTFTCGLHASGNLDCWGSNDFGAMGDNTAFRNTPRVVP